MSRLDADERVAREPSEGPRLSSPEIVDYLRSLPRLWAETGPEGRHALATALFARIDVLGLERPEYELAEDAIGLGLDAALPQVVELGHQISEFGRGERDSPSLTHPPAGLMLINRTPTRTGIAEHSA